ncbi:MAG: hypothetical protein QNJ97_04035 [Myxococcota bacterium]|nr:hypothetical protein [Myxococcota bacterium]
MVLVNINWLEKLGELSIIVVGILVAFSLDSCWEAISDSSKEQAYLVRLKADFKENQERLESTLEFEQLINDSIKTAVGLFKTPPSDKSANQLAALMPKMLTFSRFIPVSGTYGSLRYSGDIKLLSNDKLRQHLVSFDGLWELAQKELDRLGDWTYEILSRPVAQEFVLAELQLIDPNQQGDLLKMYKEQVDFVDLLADKRFSKFIADLWMGSNRRIITYQVLLDEIKWVNAELVEVEAG